LHVGGGEKENKLLTRKGQKNRKARRQGGARLLLPKRGEKEGQHEKKNTAWPGGFLAGRSVKRQWAGEKGLGSPFVKKMARCANHQAKSCFPCQKIAVKTQKEQGETGLRQSTRRTLKHFLTGIMRGSGRKKIDAAGGSAWVGESQ